MKKRKKGKATRRLTQIAPQRLVEGPDFRINERQGRRIDISTTGMARIVEEWLKGRTSILVIDGSEAVKIQGKKF
jgi:hypothetical protein